MPPAFCTTEDVREALQKPELAGTVSTDNVKPAMYAVSRWFRNQSGGYWYDSGTALGGDVPTSARTVSTDHLSVPSSPHPQENHLWATQRDRLHVRYPVTHTGPYARIRLPHKFVDTLSTLEVREYGGDVTDWVAASDKTEGRGDDYYVQTQGITSHGVSHLYVRANSIGPRENFTDLITAEYSHGQDYATDPWDDVRRGIALLAAAQIVHDDNVLAQIPDNGQLVSVETQRQALQNDAIGEAWSLLSPWLDVNVA